MMFIRLMLLIFISILGNYCFGQSGNLIPLDSSNFIIVDDTKFDIYTDTPFKFQPEKLKYCSCIVEGEFGLISCKTVSNKIQLNRCFYIYQSNASYFIRVGILSNQKNEFDEYIWQYMTFTMKEKSANEIYHKVTKAISESKIPVYKSLKNYPIVMDATSYIFGDIKNKMFAVSPADNFSDLVSNIIKLSEKQFAKYLK